MSHTQTQTQTRCEYCWYTGSHAPHCHRPAEAPAPAVETPAPAVAASDAYYRTPQRTPRKPATAKQIAVLRTLARQCGCDGYDHYAARATIKDWQRDTTVAQASRIISARICPCCSS